MADLWIRDLPDELVESYRWMAKTSGKALDTYVREVLQEQQPALVLAAKSNAALVALTEQNLARFSQPLPAMRRREMREDLEE